MRDNLHNFFCDNLIKQRYKQAPKLKMNKKKYSDDIKSAWFAGFLAFAEEIRSCYKRKEYSDVETIIGDIDYLFVVYYKKYQKSLTKGDTPNLSIEDLLKEYE